MIGYSQSTALSLKGIARSCHLPKDLILSIDFIEAFSSREDS